MVKSAKGEFLQKLVNIKRPSMQFSNIKNDFSLLRETFTCESNTNNASVLRIPTLAIHLERQEKFEFNKETQLFPIAGLIAAELNRRPEGQNAYSNGVVSNRNDAPFSPLAPASERHHPYLVCELLL